LVIAIFAAGCGYELTRVLPDRQNPWARQFETAMRETLPAMGFGPGEPIEFIPVDQHIYREYYDRSSDSPTDAARFMVVQVRQRDPQLEKIKRTVNAIGFDPPTARD